MWEEGDVLSDSVNELGAPSSPMLENRAPFAYFSIIVDMVPDEWLTQLFIWRINARRGGEKLLSRSVAKLQPPCPCTSEAGAQIIHPGEQRRQKYKCSALCDYPKCVNKSQQILLNFNVVVKHTKERGINKYTKTSYEASNTQKQKQRINRYRRWNTFNAQQHRNLLGTHSSAHSAHS